MIVEQAYLATALLKGSGKLWPVKGANMKIFEKLFYPQMGLHMKALLQKKSLENLVSKKS